MILAGIFKNTLTGFLSYPQNYLLTQNYFSYGHPVPYLKFNERTIPLLTILFRFLVTYITEFKS